MLSLLKWWNSRNKESKVDSPRVELLDVKPIKALDSGPVAGTGPLTIHLAPSVEFPVFIPDLDLKLRPGLFVDLGSFYTQKQIYDSLNLKQLILEGTVIGVAVGTAPSREPVDATITISPGTITIGEVYIRDGVTDVRQTVKNDGTDNASVTIQNAPTPGVALDSTLQSILTALGGSLTNDSRNIYSEQAAVAASSTVTILSYTVPALQTSYVEHMSGSGDTIGLYDLKVNGLTIEKRRTNFALFNFDAFFETSNGLGMKLNAGDVLTIDVTNKGSSSSSFNARIYGRLQ